MNIVRRYGTTPKQRGSLSGDSCPDVLRLDTGDYLVIGTRTGPRLRAQLGDHAASIGLNETAVVVPADVLHAAARDIAKEQLA